MTFKKREPYRGGDGGGDFSVKEAYRKLQLRVAPIFPVKDIWLPCVPSKVAFILGRQLRAEF